MEQAHDDELRILHLSDTHLFGDDSAHYGIVDTRAALERVLTHASNLGQIDAVIVSGDLSEDGSLESYHHLRTTMDAFAHEHGAQVVYAMGNHDHPQHFEQVLGPREGFRTVKGFRIIHLDSTVPGKAYGRLSSEQLVWLRDVLRTPAPRGSVVVVHHPPISATTPLLRRMELQYPQELLLECSSADVQLILSGHYHHNMVTKAEGITVVVAPAITNTADVVAPFHLERATVGSGYAVIELPESRISRTSIVAVPGPHDGEELFCLQPEEIDAVAEKFGVPQG